MWRERRKLVDMWRTGHAAALATLVAVEGSSYRRPGARLMIGSDGGSVGSISGGCLEAEITRKARWLVRDGARVQRYSTAIDDTSDIPYGLGCGGAVDILIEPAGTPEFQNLMEALANSLLGEAAEVYTSLPLGGRPLSRIIRASPAELHPGEDDPLLRGPALHHEHLEPPQRLLVFGAGDDAQALVSMAATLGWRVLVLDARAHLARPERFPDAERVVAAPPSAPLPLLLQRNDFAVVMTHSFEQDRGWLERLLPESLEYLGLLGARHRSARLAGEVASLLGWTLDRVCDRLRAPVGLDLGGDGAETIALSIVAEMQACAAHRPLLSRRMDIAAVSEQIAQADTAAQAPVLCLM